MICPRCNGKGHITTKADIKECPECLGAGEV